MLTVLQEADEAQRRLGELLDPLQALDRMYRCTAQGVMEDTERGSAIATGTDPVSEVYRAVERGFGRPYSFPGV